MAKIDLNGIFPPIPTPFINEKVAYEEALGMSWAGKRALVCMKHVGLNVAADPFMNSALVPIQGGLVCAVADDPGMHSSQNEQDTRLFGKLANVPVLEPSDAQEALDFTRLAFELSERFDSPVIVRGTTRLSHTRSLVRVGEREEHPPRGFAPDPAKYVMLPVNARLRHPLLVQREAELQAWLETSDLIRWERGSFPAMIIPRTPLRRASVSVARCSATTSCTRRRPTASSTASPGVRSSAWICASSTTTRAG